MPREKGGVTLIELAVVMAIVAIIGLFLAPALGDWLDNFRIRQSAREMSADLQFAKMKAISMGRYCSVVFNRNVGGTEYAYVIFPDYDKDLILDSGNETNDIFKTVSLKRNVVFDTTQGSGDGITFLNNANGKPSIAFDGNGMPKRASGAFGAGTVYMKNTKNDKSRKIVLSSVGRIRIEEY